MLETLERVRTGAEALVSTLYEHGTKDIFLIPGANNLPICDALHEDQRIKYYLFRHEQGMAFAAAGYARALGKPGVFLATSGPGVLNTLTAIANAKWDSTPLVGICGQVPTSIIGREGFQESDIVAITKPITKWSYQIQDANDIPFVLDEAFMIASQGRPGPVLIDIPKDIQTLPTSSAAPRMGRETMREELAPQLLIQLEQAARMIDEAENVLIIAGQGITISRTESHLRRLAEKTQRPVASTLNGISTLPSDHPFFVGMIGTHGTAAANMLADQAHVIVVLGARLEERATGGVPDFGKHAKIIHIDIDEEQLGKRVPAELAIQADLKTALPALLELVEEKPKELNNTFHSTTTLDIRRILAADTKLSSADAISLLFERTSEDDIIVSDAGLNQMLVARHGKFKRSGSFITTGGQGAMGFSIPAAIGVQIAYPDRRVIAITGDGGFQMNEQELGTIMQYQLPIRIIIWNDDGYGMIRHFGIHSSFTNLLNPDFVTLAAAYRMTGVSADNYEELDRVYSKIFFGNDPCLVELKVPIIKPFSEIVQQRVN